MFFKKLRKKFLFLIILLIVINSCLSVFAEVVSFQVPTEVTFAINPNIDNGFISPDINIKNLSTTPLNVDIKNFNYFSGLLNNPVKPTDYTNEQWSNMGISDSISKISLSLIKKTTSIWDSYTGIIYNASDDQVDIKRMGILLPDQEVTLSILGKHGHAFPIEIKSKYKITFIFSVSDYLIPTSTPTSTPINTPIGTSTSVPISAPINTPSPVT